MSNVAYRIRCVSAMCHLGYRNYILLHISGGSVSNAEDLHCSWKENKIVVLVVRCSSRCMLLTYHKHAVTGDYIALSHCIAQCPAVKVYIPIHHTHTYLHTHTHKHACMHACMHTHTYQTHHTCTHTILTLIFLLQYNMNNAQYAQVASPSFKVLVVLTGG